MNGVVKRSAFAAAELSGGAALARRLTAERPRILMFHNFASDAAAAADRTSATMFRRQLAHLRRHYRPVRLRELGRYLADGRDPPAGCIAVTVDDGHANFLDVAVPVLRELEIPATLFVLSELSNSGDWLWTDKWEYVCTHAAGPAVRPPTLTALRQLPAAERERRLDDFARQVGVRIPARPPAPYALVSWDDLKDLATSELIDIGSHTRTHPILSHVEADEAWDEIDGSRRALERRLEVEIATFCFPNGLPADYRPEHVAMVARAGYVCGTAAHFGYVTPRANRFALPRVGGVFGSLATFRHEVDGLAYLWRRLRGERM